MLIVKGHKKNISFPRVLTFVECMHVAWTHRYIDSLELEKLPLAKAKYVPSLGKSLQYNKCIKFDTTYGGTLKSSLLIADCLTIQATQPG